MKVTVIGASGFVGSYLYDYFKKKCYVVGTFTKNSKNDLERLDITLEKEVDKFFQKHRPETVLLPAALPNVDWCETHREEAEKVNVGGVRNVAFASRKYDSKLVYFSTDYIFDGTSGPYTEEAIPKPLNYYGLTKLLGEKEVRQALNNHLITRVTWVYGWDKSSKNFADSTIKLLRAGKKRNVAVDQFATPTYVESISEAVEKLMENNKTGIYNLVGPDYVSRSEFVYKIADVFNLDKNLIIADETKNLFHKAKRPLKGGLLINKLIKDTNYVPATIKDALKRMKQIENWVSKE